MTIRIAMWSGPRNISTAMMRSFGARADCAVSDEPFYGAFLKDSGERHPMGAETIAAMDCDWHSVLATQSGEAPGGAPISDLTEPERQLTYAEVYAQDE